jgi:ppGpp synthetase/RelA/SpoT-type nucleotidyltranferase
MDGITEAIPRPGSNPLADSYLKAAAKEIEQTAVAVSVMGTAPWKLKQMAGLAEPVADALEGERPEVAKPRSALKRLIHNTKTSSIKAHQASKALRALAKGLTDTRRMVAKGLGNADPFLRGAGFEIVNTWGYTSSEIRDATRTLEATTKVLNGVGLPTAVGGLAELNPARVKGSAFVQYDPHGDLFIFDLAKSGSGNLESVLRAVGERLWLQEFGRGDKETWGNGRGSGAFSRAFAELLTGRRVDADTMARLQVSVGKLAARWPEAKSQEARGPSALERILQEIRAEIGDTSTRKDGSVWKKVEQPRKWKKVKGTFGAHTPEEEAEIEVKKRQDLKDAIHRIGKFVAAGKLKKGVTVGGHIRIAKKALDEHKKRIGALKVALGSIAGDKGVVTGRVKTLASTLGKLTKVDPDGNAKYQTAEDMPDLTGTRIVVNTIGDVYGVVAAMQRQADKRGGIGIKKSEDKIEEPLGDVKYRSFHIDIRDKDGKIKELQVRTRRQNVAADWSHDQHKPFSPAQERVLKKYREKIVDYAAKVSDYFYSQDQGKDPGEPPKCPKVVSLYFGCIT